MGDPAIEQLTKSKSILEQGCESLDWIFLIQVRGQYLAFVNTVMNYGFHERMC
jgi:hypothetical protein